VYGVGESDQGREFDGERGRGFLMVIATYNLNAVQLTYWLLPIFRSRKILLKLSVIPSLLRQIAYAIGEINIYDKFNNFDDFT
jgi:hypothetical protein